MIESVLMKLRRLASLSEADLDAVSKWRLDPKTVSAKRPIVREGQHTGHCAVLIEGVACRSKRHVSGERQIVSFHFAGDMLDLQHLWFERADHSLEAVSARTIAWVDYDELRATMAAAPKVGEVFWRDTLIEASIFREWILNVGRRPGLERVAHLLCEVQQRMVAAEVLTDRPPDALMTQEYLADATEMTSVHVNRMVGELRVMGALPERGEAFTAAHLKELRAVAAFDNCYLHQLAS